MVFPGNKVPSEAAGAKGLPSLSKIRNPVFHPPIKWFGPTAPVGSDGV